jgi:prophage tail gpP-like protein
MDLPPGATCQVKIGADVVITGYVDRRLSSFGPGMHQIRLQGRGKCEDLVDCSITPDQIQGMSIFTSSLLDLANKLGKPYNVTASSLTGDNVPLVFPNGSPLQFNANLQQTPYEVLEMAARFVGVLVYEGTDGNLIIAEVGTSTMASGFAQGTNVQNASVGFTMDERFSDYLPVLMSTNFFGQGGIGGKQFPWAFDKGVTRFRQRIVVSEQFDQVGASFAETSAQ